MDAPEMNRSRCHEGSIVIQQASRRLRVSFIHRTPSIDARMLRVVIPPRVLSHAREEIAPSSTT
jgi:hypothetical protein